jgi:hypothetical protein
VLIAAEAEAKKRASTRDPKLYPNYLFHALYDTQAGVYGLRKGNPYGISRREFIESTVQIKTKRRKLELIRYNQSQRNMEASVLRQERNAKAVRIVILKVRQNGISTYIIAFAFWLMLTHTDVKVRIIADREDLCETLLDRVRLVFRELCRGDGKPWNLVTTKSNRDMIVLAEPIHSSIHVVSANTPDPGHGETVDLLDMEETARWPDAERKAKGVEMTLPEVEGSYAFDVSTAFGNTGYYARKFKAAWERKTGIGDPTAGEALMAGGGWQPVFFPWFLHEENRWSWINEMALPHAIAGQILETLDAEEKILMGQTYHLRGQPPRNVDLDQLAWRRYFISEKCNGNLDTFHEQAPAFVDEAFLASGRPAFEIGLVKKLMLSYQSDPTWVGELLPIDEEGILQ